MLCLSVFSMRTVLTLVCVDDAVSQCGQHADSLHVGVCRWCCVSVCSACGQASRWCVSMPLCLSVFSMRTVVTEKRAD